ncbi:MAG: hypothetical protein M3R15_19980 [Acidobacteriota bacterium]|nr:hypothetical protein [Acidobacteriota bacterium]
MDERLYQILSDLNAEAPKVRAAFNDLFDPALGFKEDSLMLFDFWKALPYQQCVHPKDREVLAKHSGIFELGIPPGHVSGRLKTAPVVACYLNPGFEEADRVYFSRETERRLLFEQINGESDFPLWFERWRKWFLQRVRFGQMTDAQLASTVAIFNVCAYASKNANQLKPSIVKNLPSSKIARRYLHEVLIPQAQRRERFVVIARGCWAWQVDRSIESDNIRFAPNPTGGHFGPEIRDVISKWLESRSTAET